MLTVKTVNTYIEKNPEYAVVIPLLSYIEAQQKVQDEPFTESNGHFRVSRSIGNALVALACEERMWLSSDRAVVNGKRERTRIKLNEFYFVLYGDVVNGSDWFEYVVVQPTTNLEASRNG